MKMSITFNRPITVGIHFVETDSAVCKKIGYLAEQQILVIGFPNGSFRGYATVTAKEYAQFMDSESFGHAFQQIKATKDAFELNIH
jgi:hypothetical protein